VVSKLGDAGPVLDQAIKKGFIWFYGNFCPFHDRLIIISALSRACFYTEDDGGLWLFPKVEKVRSACSIKGRIARRFKPLGK
jgi:hypothetical protein